ncbi:MAG: LamB/YcsF family protein [Vicinamibacterales bacterium]
MARTIDFNCDMGESFGAYTMGNDEAIMPFVTSANIACGFHAGDSSVMRRTVEMARRQHLGIGAHPGFPDLRGFGRRNLGVTPAEVYDDVTYQMGALSAFVPDQKLQHVKPHGALYNMAVIDRDIASAISDAVGEMDPGLILVALAGSAWVSLAAKRGLRVAREVFADRAVRADGTLVPRSVPGSVIRDRNEVVERSLRLVTEETVVAITGEIVSMPADTICLHGDTPGALELASALRSAFETAGVEVVPMGRFVV